MAPLVEHNASLIRATVVTAAPVQWCADPSNAVPETALVLLVLHGVHAPA